jgi:sensor histidine kinase YesM
MKWRNLFFSDQQYWRCRRHIFFWLTWWILFTVTYFYTQQGLTQAGTIKWISIVFIKSFLMLLCHVFLVYAVVYHLLPRYFLKKKYFSFIWGFMLAGIITISWGYFCYALLFRQFDKIFRLPSVLSENVLFWNSITAGFISSLKVVMAAAAIKMLKNWILKQNEKERLEKERTEVDLQLLKAQIHPDFLFNTLGNIRLFAQNNPAKANELLLKLSDLLSYMLYECDQPKVLLEKEIKMIRNYMELEKKRLGERLEINIHVQGDFSGKMIAPLILLPFVENSIFYCCNEKLEKSWINLDLRIEANELIFKIVNGKPKDKVIPESPLENGLASVYKRLEILYKQQNEIRINANDEMMITVLKIKFPDEEKQCPKIENEQMLQHG